MDYSVDYNDETGEYVATAGDDSYSVASIHLAYLWIAQQIGASDED